MDRVPTHRNNVIGPQKTVLLLMFTIALVIVIVSNHVQIPTLGLSIRTGILLVSFMSILICFLMYLRHNLDMFEKHGLLFLIRSTHYFTLLIMVMYVFVFSPESDIIYLVFVAIIMCHWFLIKNECILTYLESKMIDPKYVMGEDPYRNTFIKLIAGEHTVWFTIVLTLAMFLNAGIVIMRLPQIPFVLRIMATLLIFIHQLYNNTLRLDLVK